MPDPIRIQQFLLCTVSFHTLYLFYIHSSLDASSAGVLTRLHLPSGRRSNRVLFAEGEEDFRFLLASRLVLGATSFLSREYRRPFPWNKASWALVENFFSHFSDILWNSLCWRPSLCITTSKIHKFIATRNKTTQRAVCADVPLYVSLLQKRTNFIPTFRVPSILRPI